MRVKRESETDEMALGSQKEWSGRGRGEFLLLWHRLLNSHCKVVCILGCNTSPHPSTKPGKDYAQASFRVKEVIFVDIKKTDHIPHLCPSEAEDELHVEKSKIIYNLS